VLRHVSDGAYTNDIDNQKNNNYTYDEIGNLIQDKKGEIDRIEWTLYGKVKKVTKDNGNLITFAYDAAGNRIKKTTEIKGSVTTTYYTRDAQGNVLAVYTNDQDGNNDLYLSEVPLYGSSRLGEWRPRRLLDIVAAENTVTTLSGEKTYELSNHLGNVLAVVSDVLQSPSSGGVGEASVVSATDYYAFGQEMPGRTFASEDYRYGFNGKENDREWGESLIQDYGMRLYNPALCRFLSVDPIAKSYPELTVYQFASNTPVWGIDLDGLEVFYSTDGTRLGQIGSDTQVRVVNANATLEKGKYKSTNIVEGSIAKYNKEGGTWNDMALKNSAALGVDESILLSFSAVIQKESGGDKNESYVIANCAVNYLSTGGSSTLKTLEDITMYKNSFQRGATQENYTAFMEKDNESQKDKFAIEAAINAVGYDKKIKNYGFKDDTNGATHWDGIDLIDSKKKNDHRNGIWSSDSKTLLEQYKKDNNGGVDVSKFNYKDNGYEFKATAIIGKSLFRTLATGRGESKIKTDKNGKKDPKNGTAKKFE
jgi:RHS repeat-associated protein